MYSAKLENNSSAVLVQLIAACIVPSFHWSTHLIWSAGLTVLLTDYHSAPWFCWLNPRNTHKHISDRVTYKLGVMVYKCLHGQALDYV